MATKSQVVVSLPRFNDWLLVSTCIRRVSETIPQLAYWNDIKVSTPAWEGEMVIAESIADTMLELPFSIQEILSPPRPQLFFI